MGWVEPLNLVPFCPKSLFVPPATCLNQFVPISSEFLDFFQNLNSSKEPENFANASLLSEYLGRDEQIVFDQRLVEVKNSIYKNIYNNLTHIYKTKGTSDAIRNFIRCLGVGSEILALNTYANDSDFTLESTYQIDTRTKHLSLIHI